MEIGLHGVSGQNALQLAKAEENQDLESVILLHHQEGERIVRGQQAKSEYVIQRNAPVSICIIFNDKSFSNSIE